MSTQTIGAMLERNVVKNVEGKSLQVLLLADGILL
jgi:hypothetical protein